MDTTLAQVEPTWGQFGPTRGQLGANLGSYKGESDDLNDFKSSDSPSKSAKCNFAIKNQRFFDTFLGLTRERHTLGAADSTRWRG